MISVLVLTHNEAHDLPGALASVAWSDDIHVVDSNSTDSTAEIAKAAGAHVHRHAFQDYATQRNFGLQLPFQFPWLFILDADERATPQLADEIQSTIRNLILSGDHTLAAFSLRRRDFLFGTWLKHAQLSPFYLRLVRHRRVRYTRAVNEILEVDGITGTLHHSIDHFPFSKGLAHWIDRHNRYSTLEAELIHHNQHTLQRPSLRTALSDPDFHTRRLHQKAIFYRFGAARPILKWLFLVLVRGAFLDGPAGLTYATLQAIYEFFIVLKTKELRTRKTQELRAKP